MRRQSTRRSVAHGAAAVVVAAVTAIGLADPASAGSPPPASSPSKATTTYTVVKGDTLSAIAARTGVATSSIAAANSLQSPYRLSIGMRLVIPRATAPKPSPKPATKQSTTGARKAGTTRSGGPGPSAAQETRGGPVAGTSYRVRRGDTVIGLAKRAGVSAAAIIATNGLAPPSYMIRDGRTLQIPNKGAVGKPVARPQTPAPGTKAVPPGGGRHPNKAQVGSALEANARRYGLPADLVKGIAWQESGWRQEVVSSTGAVGVMQLMPGTAKWVGDNLVRRRIDSNDYNDNVQGGSAYLKWLFGQMNQDERLAIASYYQGPGSVKKRGLLKESERYVAGVQANRKKFR
ncbi:MAG: LysM peptidoglycan-binding domain-containing protein [Acidimicrobiia bacterium]